MTEKWEYFTTFVFARAERALDEVKKIRKNAGKYAPEAMIPELNSLGEQSWELVHMEPAYVGKNDDILVTETATRWADAYFCVFKRRKS